MVEYKVTSHQSGHADLQLRGRLIREIEAEELGRALEVHYVDDGVIEIRVDLSELREISLEGIAVLLDLRTKSRRRGKRFVVTGASGQVLEKLQITGTFGPLQDG